LPDPSITDVLSRVQRRWRVRAAADAIAVAGAVFAAALTMVSAGAALLPAIVAGSLMWVRAGRLTATGAARAIEAASPSDNLLVTAAEIESVPRPIRAEIRDEILRQASARARNVDVAAAVPLRQSVAVAAVVLAGCAILSGVVGRSLPEAVRAVVPGLAPPDAATSFEVHITPPAYTKRKAETLQEPIQVSVIAGSRIQVPAANRDWIATESRAIDFRTGGQPRFLSVIVVPDLPPSVRIAAPGKDTAFADAKGRVEVSIQTGDDLGLASLALRFTKASGGGENVSFTEGEAPLRVERRTDREWIGRTDLSLEALGLADGDIVVYHAIARDTNPAGSPVSSDQYVIEIGKNASIADAGFALPTEDRKYAISQQMVIYKTEQLLKERPRIRQGTGETGSGDWLDQSRGLAVEQRMVRAEVIFLGGGEVQDEVEEAAHSHELAEGRLENSGRAEMLRAINAMSRAEAQLNDGRVTEALVFEREALKHLELALDRRRYFLRTLPDRSRIDTTRRLTGERREARSWNRDRQEAPAVRSIEAQRAVMRALAAGTSDGPALAARVASVDPSSTELQRAAVAVASASTDAARREAAQAAMTALTNHALRSLPSSAAVGLPLDPLSGRLADELTQLRPAGGQGPRQ
jgi:hypothetical protein